MKMDANSDYNFQSKFSNGEVYIYSLIFRSTSGNYVL